MTSEVVIRKIQPKDHSAIAEMFQEFQLNNNHRNESKAVSESKKVSLAGLRIDERGGIYLNPLLDSNTSYFKCYVAEEDNVTLGYILLFDVVAIEHNLRQDPVAVIQDIYVKPNRRKRGIGKALFLKAVQISLDKRCEGLEINFNTKSKPFLCKILSKATWKKNRIAQEKFGILTRQEMIKLTENL